MKKREEKVNRAIINTKEVKEIMHLLRQDATKTMSYFKQIDLYHKKIQKLHLSQISRLEIIIDRMEIIKNNEGVE